MNNQTPLQAIVVDAATIVSGQKPIQLALFNVDGTARPVPQKALAQANFAGADLTALKVELNAFLVKLRNAGTIAT